MLLTRECDRAPGLYRRSINLYRPPQQLAGQTPNPEAWGRGQHTRYPVVLSHSSPETYLAGRALTCLMWEDLISGRNPVPPFPSSHCTSAVTCDCISPQVTKLPWQRPPPAGLIIELRVILYQHVYVATEGW